MNDQRVIVGHAHAGLNGPHIELPSGFVPLRLRVEGTSTRIEVVCPVAIIGRHSESDLRLADPEISRRHCRLTFENGEWRVHDLKSLNGVVLNNKSVTDAVLFAGDRMRLGPVRLYIESATPRRVLLPEDEKETAYRPRSK